MTLFIIAILFTLSWAAVTGSFAAINLVFGLALSIIVLYLLREKIGTLGFFSRSRKILALIILFIKELMLSAWKVAVLVMSPKMELKPGIFAFPLTVTSDFEITLLANLITLTPGTLSVDVSEDRKYIFVHAVDCSDPDGTIRDIADGFEAKIMEAFR
jgi:multicomponent Na+:H+ antiporter subunit E